MLKLHARRGGERHQGAHLILDIGLGLLGRTHHVFGSAAKNASASFLVRDCLPRMQQSIYNACFIKHFLRSFRP